jgi:hypothetical protein
MAASRERKATNPSECVRMRKIASVAPNHDAKRSLQKQSKAFCAVINQRGRVVVE